MAVVTSAFSKKFRFAVHTNAPSDVFKSIHFGERFQEDPFSVSKNVVLVWKDGQSGEQKFERNLSCFFDENKAVSSARDL